MTDLLKLSDLTVTYGGRRAAHSPAVEALELSIEPGEVLSLIGESGSGKSTVVRAIANLLPPATAVSGDMRLRGREGNLLAPSADWRGINGREIGMIFQNPVSSLNPMLTVEAHLDEVLASHGTEDRATRPRR